MAQHPQPAALAAAETKVKVACQSCGARFVVRDPRVRGHRFRATCKRCGALIVGMAAADEAKPPNGDGRIAPTASVAAPARDAEQWYIVKRGKPKGPYSRDELRQALESGQLPRKTYVWRSGEADWRRITDVPELTGDAADAPDEPSEASTHFFQAADNEPEDEPTPLEDDPDPEDEPTRLAAGGDGGSARHEWSMEVEVTRLVRGRHDELSSKLMRLPNPAAWQPPAQARPPDPAFGAAPGKVAPAGIGGAIKRPPALPAAAAAGLWAAVPRRPAILPAPSRRHTLAGFASPASPQQTAVSPPGAEPVAALLAAAAAASTHPPTSVPVQPPSFTAPRPVAATIADPPNALSWVPNPVPLGAVGLKPPAPPLLLPKPPRFWTPTKIALIAGLPVALAIIALVITLLLTRSSEPPPAPELAEAVQVAIAVQPPPATPPERAAPPAKAKPAAPEQAAAPAKPAPTPAKVAAAPVKSAPPTPPAKPAVAPTKPAPAAAPAKPAPRAKAAPREVTVAVRTETKRIAPRRSASRSAGGASQPDEDDLLAGAVQKRQKAAKPARRAASGGGGGGVDVDAMLEAGASGRPKKASAPRGEAGGPALSSGVDTDALLSAGGGGGGGARGPSKLSRDQIRSTMSKLRGHVKSCFASQPGAKGIVELEMTVQPDGSASGRAAGRYAGSAEGNCAARGASGLRFPRFSGPAMRFKFPFAL